MVGEVFNCIPDTYRFPIKIFAENGLFPDEVVSKYILDILFTLCKLVGLSIDIVFNTWVL